VTGGGPASALVPDHLGSPRRTVDASGGVTGTDFDAFGIPSAAASPGTLGFAGGTNLAAGLERFGLRLYSAELGRFLTPEPAGQREGASLAAYVYARNDPLNRTDLSGEWSLQGLLGGASGAVGGAVTRAASLISQAWNTVSAWTGRTLGLLFPPTTRSTGQASGSPRSVAAQDGAWGWSSSLSAGAASVSSDGSLGVGPMSVGRDGSASLFGLGSDGRSVSVTPYGVTGRHGQVSVSAGLTVGLAMPAGRRHLLDAGGQMTLGIGAQVCAETVVKPCVGPSHSTTARLNPMAIGLNLARGGPYEGEAGETEALLRSLPLWVDQ
jgi:RHS repeat-associated protein